MSTGEFAGVWVTSPDDPRLAVLWPGSEDYGDDLEFPLAVSRIQCEAFAPAIDPVTSGVPDNYVAGQIMQARALVRAGIVGSGDQTGTFGETVTVFPLDWTVKQLLRPKRGKPRFGGRRASVSTPVLEPQ